MDNVLKWQAQEDPDYYTDICAKYVQGTYMFPTSTNHRRFFESFGEKDRVSTGLTADSMSE